MKKTFIALSLLFASFLFFASAAAEATVSPEYRELDYTLNVGGETYHGTAFAPASIPAEMSALKAEGYVGTREDAVGILQLLDRKTDDIQELSIRKEYTYHYRTDEDEISFLPSGMRYCASRMDRYDQTVTSWASFVDQDRYTSVDIGYNMAWEEIPSIQNTAFIDRIREVYDVLTLWGIETGPIEVLVYWDAQTLSKNREWLVELHGGERYAFQDEDAIIELHIPTYVDGVRLKSETVATRDDMLSDERTYVSAYMTEESVIYIQTNCSLFEAYQIDTTGTVLTAEEALERYETYLNQMLVLPEGTTNIVGVQLEYDVWCRLQAGVFSPTYHFTPVWSIYTDTSYPCVSVMFNAFDGSEVIW